MLTKDPHLPRTQVLLVRHTASRGLFAMKSIHKRHVLAHQELQHTLTEQSVLKRMAKDVNDPFVVKLWWSFHDRANLYLVMDFHPGGDLATQLSTAMDGPAPEIVGGARPGDVRHVTADPSRARERLGFTARVGFAEGITAFATDPLRDAVR